MIDQIQRLDFIAKSIRRKANALNFYTSHIHFVIDKACSEYRTREANCLTANLATLNEIILRHLPDNTSFDLGADSE